MSRVKVFGLILLFGLLSVIITIVGFILVALSVFLIPFAIVFTGLWFIWFITQDYDDTDSPD